MTTMATNANAEIRCVIAGHDPRGITDIDGHAEPEPVCQPGGESPANADANVTGQPSAQRDEPEPDERHDGTQHGKQRR